MTGAWRFPAAARHPAMMAAVLVLLTLAAFSPAIRHGGFVWDDDDHVTNNATVQSPGGLATVWLSAPDQTEYYPVTLSVFWIEYRIWGLKPWPYHLLNVLLHAANAVLVWLILRRLKVKGAWLAAALFAVHPVQAESVAWVTELKNVLSGLFFLLAILSYLRFAGLASVEVSAEGTALRRPWGWYALAFLAFTAAVLSKTVTCTLPAVLLILLWWKRPRIRWRDVWPLIPMLAAGLAPAVFTAVWEKTHIGSHGLPWNYSLIARCLMACRALVFYPAKLLWPTQLAFSYPLWKIDATAWRQYAFVAVVAGVLAALIGTRRRLGRGPMAALLIFVAVISPALGFIDYYTMRYSLVADHYQYLACISLIALLVHGAAGWAARLSGGAAGVWRTRLPGAVIGGAVVGLLAGLTYRQAGLYRDAATLWMNTAAHYPRSFLAHEQLGQIYFAQARSDPAHLAVQMERAVGELRRAAELRPEMGVGWTNLGNGLAAMGQNAEAREAYQRALRAADTNANDQAYLHLNIGGLLARQGSLKEAEGEFREALRLKADLAAAYRYLGLLVKQRGGAEKATGELLARIVQQDPKNAGARGLWEQINALSPATMRGGAER